MGKCRAAVTTAILAVAVVSLPARAWAASEDEPVVMGIKLSVGGRYDDVRMCVGSPPGFPGGPALDISFFAEMPVEADMRVSVNVPVMRPIMFAAAFGMLQFEPDVTLLYRRWDGRRADFWLGPTVGLTLHYGPDHDSARSGEDRGPSFFAMGPKFGGTFAFDFGGPGVFDFQLALMPYITSLFSIDDPEDHKGVVIGGQLQGLFGFAAGGDE
jgi:hypothetical protein